MEQERCGRCGEPVDEADQFVFYVTPTQVDHLACTPRSEG